METIDFATIVSSPLVWGLVGGGMVVSLLIGLSAGGSGKRRLRAAMAEHDQQVIRAEGQAKEHQRSLARMRSELDTINNLAMHLPPTVRNLNRDDLEPREIPRMIMQLANAIFQPRQILLYEVRSWTPELAPQGLYLKDFKGIEGIPDALRVIPPGEGKLGWIADHELDYTEEDWRRLARNEGTTVPDNHPALKSDIVGPLVHHSKEGPKVLGVLSIGSPAIRPRDEKAKLMFQLVTNLGAVALVSAQNTTQLRHMANNDGLTGLLNKRYFMTQLLPEWIVRSGKEAKRFSLFIFDIDHFKNYNDTNGHPAGDDLLRRMGRLIRESLRPGDFACRYGGEEFVIAMPETDLETACQRAESLRALIASTTLPHGEKQPLKHISVSGGIATFPQHGDSGNEILKHADEALYKSKQGGRDAVAPYQSVEIGSVNTEVALEAETASGVPVQR